MSRYTCVGYEETDLDIIVESNINNNHHHHHHHNDNNDNNNNTNNNNNNELTSAYDSMPDQDQDNAYHTVLDQDENSSAYHTIDTMQGLNNHNSLHIQSTQTTSISTSTPTQPSTPTPTASCTATPTPTSTATNQTASTSPATISTMSTQPATSTPSAPNTKSSEPVTNKLDWNWNERFQQILEKPEFSASQRFSKYQALSTLASDFIEIASQYSKVIITEQFAAGTSLPRTIPPVDAGGTAGGTKYIVAGILFKLCCDPIISSKSASSIRYLYGGSQSAYELASKACSHDLKGGMSYLETSFTPYGRYGTKHSNRILDKSECLRIPIQCIIEYWGYRITAMPLLSLYPDVIYGTADAGKHVYASNTIMNQMMKECGQIMHLAEHHVCGQAILHSAGDVEGRLGRDGRYYLLDFARTFPPESPNICKHLPIIGATHLTRLLRPEFLQQLKQDGSPPLSADAYSGFACDRYGRITPEAKQHNQRVNTATRSLLTTITNFTHKVVNGEIPIDDITINCSRILHHYGINIRHIGLIRSLLPENHPCRIIFLSTIIVRTIKNLLRQQQRTSLDTDLSLPSESRMRQTICVFLNQISGAATAEMNRCYDPQWSRRTQQYGIDPDEFYQSRVLPGILQRFGSTALNIEEQKDVFNTILKYDGLLSNIFIELFRMTGINVTSSCQQQLIDDAIDFDFTAADIQPQQIRIKYMAILDYARSAMMFHRGIQTIKEISNNTISIVHQKRDVITDTITPQLQDLMDRTKRDQNRAIRLFISTKQYLETCLAANPLNGIANIELIIVNAYLDELYQHKQKSERILMIQMVIIIYGSAERYKIDQSNNSGTDNVWNNWEQKPDLVDVLTYFIDILSTRVACHENMIHCGCTSFQSFIIWYTLLYQLKLIDMDNNIVIPSTLPSTLQTSLNKYMILIQQTCVQRAQHIDSIVDNVCKVLDIDQVSDKAQHLHSAAKQLWNNPTFIKLTKEEVSIQKTEIQNDPQSVDVVVSDTDSLHCSTSISNLFCDDNKFIEKMYQQFIKIILNILILDHMDDEIMNKLDQYIGPTILAKIL